MAPHLSRPPLWFPSLLPPPPLCSTARRNQGEGQNAWHVPLWLLRRYCYWRTHWPEMYIFLYDVHRWCFHLFGWGHTLPSVHVTGSICSACFAPGHPSAAAAPTKWQCRSVLPTRVEAGLGGISRGLVWFGDSCICHEPWATQILCSIGSDPSGLCLRSMVTTAVWIPSHICCRVQQIPPHVGMWVGTTSVPFHKVVLHWYEVIVGLGHCGGLRRRGLVRRNTA